MSDDVAAAIDEEIRKLITQAHEEARQILTIHKDALDRIADALIERETLDADEVAEILEDVPKWEHTRAGALRIRMPEAPTSIRQGSLVASQTSDDPIPPQT